MTDKNNNHRKSSCEFAEAAVAFLYGEDGSGETAGDQKHFESCPVCADELAAFGFVRSSIQEWRDEVFAGIDTPQIVVPYQFDETAGNSASESWVNRIIRIFKQAPMIGTAAAAFAVLAVCLGIAFAIANYPGSEQVAEAPLKFDVNDPSQQVAEEVPIEIEGPLEIAVNQNEIKRLDEKQPASKSDASAEKAPRNRLANSAKHRFKSNDSTIAKDDKKKPKNNKANTPNLDELILSNFSADEDESLRLADLFDEVGSKK